MSKTHLGIKPALRYDVTILPGSIHIVGRREDIDFFAKTLREGDCYSYDRAESLNGQFHLAIRDSVLARDILGWYVKGLFLD
jgi:hypothetical protein